LFLGERLSCHFHICEKSLTLQYLHLRGSGTIWRLGQFPKWLGEAMRLGVVIAAVVALATLLSSAQQNEHASVAAAPATAAYTPVHKFDPKRDASADIQAAIIEARHTGKRIILDIGGDWCQYCHQMDQFFQQNREVLEFRDRNFVTVAVYYGSE